MTRSLARFATACTFLAIAAPSISTEQLDEDEYRLYQVLIPPGDATPTLIRGFTTRQAAEWMWNEAEFDESMKHLKERVSDPDWITDDLINSLKSSFPMEEPLDPEELAIANSRVLTREEASELSFERTKVFYVSRAGFNDARTRAIVGFAYECGPYCGEGSWVLLEKRDGQWSVVQRLQTWVA